MIVVFDKGSRKIDWVPWWGVDIYPRKRVRGVRVPISFGQLPMGVCLDRLPLCYC